MNKLFLIDFENVNEDGLKKVLNEDNGCGICLFYTKNANKITISVIEEITEKHELKVISAGTGSNSLDFCLSSFLGYLIGSPDNDNMEFIIVSNDKGFENVVRFWKERGHNVSIMTTKPQVLGKPKSRTRRSKSSDKSQPSDNKDASEAAPTDVQVQEDLNAAAEVSEETKPAEETVAPVQNEATSSKASKNADLITKNNKMTKTLADSGIDQSMVGKVTSSVIKWLKQGKNKKSIYDSMRKEFGSEDGRRMYNLISPLI